MTAKTTMSLSIATRLLVLAMALATAEAALAQARPQCGEGGPPAILLVKVPTAGGGPDWVETISGVVGGVNPANGKVVIFSLADGVWYVQPYVAAPYTDIDRYCEFETNIHLGARYAALLVRPSYQPPATLSALPSVGGDVLAVTDEPASRGHASGGAASSGLAEWWWLLVGPLIFLSLVAASKKTESFVSSVETLLSRTFAGGEKALGSWLGSCAAWLKKSGPAVTDGQPDRAHAAESQSSGNALFVLLGLIGLVIAGAAAYGDYVILNQSLSIFWPIEKTAWVIAANMVALKALVGICHQLFRGEKGKPVRRLLNFLLVVLLVCEFAIAFSRVIETDAAAEPSQMAVAAGDPQGSLTINDPDVAASKQPGDSQSTAAPMAGPENDKRPRNYFSFYAVLSGVIAVALALSETIGIRAAVLFAGTALVWLPGSILLGPLALAFCMLRFLNKSGIAGLIAIILAVSLDVLSKLGAVLSKGARIALQAVKRGAAWLRGLPSRLTNASRELRKARLRNQSELRMLNSELAGKESAASAHFSQHDMLTRKWNDAVGEILDDLLSLLKDSLHRLNERLAADVAETAVRASRLQADSITEQISSAMSEVYLKTSDAVAAVDGHRANQSARRDVRHNGGQNSGGLK